MKNASLKKIIVTVLGIALVLSMVFVISSCKKHEHTLKETVLTEATCDSDGVLQIRCTDEDCDYTQEQSISATGHNNVVTIIKNPTCTTNGEVQTRCTNCGKSSTDVVKAPGHNKITVEKQAPTCTTAGYEKHEKCTKCSWTTLTDSDVLDPLDHVKVKADDRQKKKPEYDLKYPTCTDSGYHYEYYECSMCGQNFEGEKVIDAPLGHDLTKVKARAASCCIGWDTFNYCNGWSKTELAELGFPYMPAINSSGPNINDASNGCGYNEYIEHPAIYDHVMTAELKQVEVVAAKCESDGVYALIKECTTCAPASEWPNWCTPTWEKDLKAKYNWYTPDVEVYTELSVTPDGTEKGVIKALGHEWQTHEAKEETCIVDGWEKFTMCSRCSVVDTDGDFSNYEEVPVVKAEHKYEPDGCLYVCVRPVVRSDGQIGVCGHVNERETYHDVTTTISYEDGESLAPTCEEKGFYTCIKYCNDCKKEITREKVEIAAHGHDYQYHIAKKPTCTDIGWNAFNTCSRCDYSDFVAIEANGHTPEETPDVVKVAYCLTEGSETHTYDCTVCGEVAKVETFVVEAIGHDIEVIPAQAATCTEQGWNAYDSCKREGCGYNNKADNMTSALGHSIVTVDAKAPTCTEQGWYAYAECTREDCEYNNKAEMMINATGHNIVTVPAQAPTCTQVGWNDYLICDVCKADSTSTYKENEIPATGHASVEEITAVKENVDPSTCLASGSYDLVKYCNHNGCGVELARETVVTDPLGHNFSNVTGYCLNDCGNRISIGLAYSNNADGTTCVVSGIGNCTDTEIIIPETINGRTVVGIGSRAFAETEITSVVIPDTVTTISRQAFFFCQDLKTVTVGTGLKTVEASAFSLCNDLSTVYYRGTAAQWNAISIATSNDNFKNPKYI